MEKWHEATYQIVSIHSVFHLNGSHFGFAEVGYYPLFMSSNEKRTKNVTDANVLWKSFNWLDQYWEFDMESHDSNMLSLLQMVLTWTMWMCWLSKRERENSRHFTS